MKNYLLLLASILLIACHDSPKLSKEKTPLNPQNLVLLSMVALV